MRARVLVLAVVCGPSAFGQERPLADRLDARSLAAFADSVVPPEMARRHIPGAVLVIVLEGRTVLARGFGLADLESRRSVDPERTRFPLASVTKVVTATAALQLVERGQLDLTADVNRYLRGARVPPYRGSSVTLHHLLTHTAGFEERLTGILCRTDREREPLATYLARSMPPRFARPGEVLSYSNHGMSLAALLIEGASGREFEDYVEEQILAPLRMDRSGFASTSDVAPDRATAYRFARGRHIRQPPDCVRSVGAGGLVTTGGDMTHFMIAHLEGGAYQGSPILRPETLDRMHARQFAPHDGLSGWAYGLWEDVDRGRRGLMHDGSGNGYRALIYLLPDRRLGFFLAYNLADQHPDGELLDVFRRKFLNAFVPARAGPDARVGPYPSDEFRGYYRYARRARTTLETFVSVANIIRIESGRDGALTMRAPGANPVSLVPIGRGLFRRSDDRGLVAFDGITGRAARRVLLDGGGLRSYERISVLSTPLVQGAWLLAMSLAFAWASLVGPAWNVVSRFYRRERSAPGLAPPAARQRTHPTRSIAWLAGVASAMNLLFIVGFPLAFLGPGGGIPAFVYGVPGAALVLLAIPPVTAVLAVATLIPLAFMWRDARHDLATRIQHSIVCAALLLFVLFAASWRLLGVQTYG